MNPSRKSLYLSEEGFGLLGVIMSVVIVVTMIGLLLTYLSNSFVYEAKMRTNALEKKSFGGAEQAMINQRQCRCNLITQATAGGGIVTFPISPAATTTVSLNKLKTYFQEDSCADTNGIDDILSDTATATATVLNQSRFITLSNFKAIIPRYLYRAQLSIAPVWAAPISFPLLLVTEPGGTGVQVKICGVDRAS